MCAKGKTYSLQKELRRMNEHLKTVHDAAPISMATFLVLEVVNATNTGPHHSYVEIDVFDEATRDFRSESDMEARVGLLSSSLLYLGKERDLKAEKNYFYKYPADGIVNPFRAGVMEVFERAATLCTDSGSTHVRQQMMRDEKNIVGSKTFRLVKPKSHDRYATNVANFVYFCNKAPWDEGGKRTFATVQDCLLHVLTEEHKSISQTFITR
jgi:hypothetical protein